MKVISKGFRGLEAVLLTICTKARFGKAITINGLYRGRVDTQITVSDGAAIEIGDDVSFQRNVSISAVNGGKLRIGNNVGFNRNSIIICRNEITIEDNVLFGPGITIYDHDHVFSDEGVAPDEYRNGTVVIENGCWIGANVVILRNTHIGQGCVIGAGAIVKGDIPAHSLVTSNRDIRIIPIEKKK